MKTLLLSLLILLPLSIKAQVQTEKLSKEVKSRLAKVPEFKFIRSEANKMGIQVYLFGGTASAFAHYVRWDMEREEGDGKYQSERFDYDFTNIYRGNQDLDLVVDGSLEQVRNFQRLLQERYPHFVGAKEAWEVRPLKEQIGDKLPLLGNFDFLNQHTDSNSTGLVALNPESEEPTFRDLFDWENLNSNFLKDVASARIRFLFSQTHSETSRYKEGKNPPIFAAVRYLAKLTQYEVKGTKEDLEIIKVIIEEEDWAKIKTNAYVRHKLEEFGKKVLLNAPNSEYAWDLLDRLGLREKLIEMDGDQTSRDTLSWWMNKEPLRTQALGTEGEKASELFDVDENGKIVVSHETKSFVAYENITRSAKGMVNVFISRSGIDGEGAAHGNGFYTRKGIRGAVGTGLTVRFILHPDARKGEDFLVAGDFIVVTNKPAVTLIQENLNVDIVDFLEMMRLDTEAHNNKGLTTKLARKFNRQESSPKEIERIKAYFLELLKSDLETDFVSTFDLLSELNVYKNKGLKDFLFEEIDKKIQKEEYEVEAILKLIRIEAGLYDIIFKDKESIKRIFSVLSPSPEALSVRTSIKDGFASWQKKELLTVLYKHLSEKAHSLEYEQDALMLLLEYDEGFLKVFFSDTDKTLTFFKSLRVDYKFTRFFDFLKNSKVYNAKGWPQKVLYRNMAEKIYNLEYDRDTLYRLLRENKPFSKIFFSDEEKVLEFFESVKLNRSFLGLLGFLKKRALHRRTRFKALLYQTITRRIYKEGYFENILVELLKKEKGFAGVFFKNEEDVVELLKSRDFDGPFLEIFETLTESVLYKNKNEFRKKILETIVKKVHKGDLGNFERFLSKLLKKEPALIGMIDFDLVYDELSSFNFEYRDSALASLLQIEAVVARFSFPKIKEILEEKLTTDSIAITNAFSYFIDGTDINKQLGSFKSYFNLQELDGEVLKEVFVRFYDERCSEFAKTLCEANSEDYYDGINEATLRLRLFSSMFLIQLSSKKRVVRRQMIKEMQKLLVFAGTFPGRVSPVPESAGYGKSRKESIEIAAKFLEEFIVGLNNIQDQKYSERFILRRARGLKASQVKRLKALFIDMIPSQAALGLSVLLWQAAGLETFSSSLSGVVTILSVGSGLVSVPFAIEPFTRGSETTRLMYLNKVVNVFRKNLRNRNTEALTSEKRMCSQMLN